jgi:hypothetical protein
MTKFVPVALLAVAATMAAFPANAAENQQVREANSAATAAVAVSAGKMLYGPNGNRLAAVYRVTSAGDVQIILDSKLRTVPASSLSDVNGKITTSLTKAELAGR